MQLLENPRVKALLDKMVEKKVNECLLTSELRPIKRIGELEKVTGIYHFEEWEEHKPTILEKIQVIEERIESSPIIPLEDSKEENPLIANTTLTKKAEALTDYLKSKKPSWSGKIVMESEEIYTFFREKIEENLRWSENLKGYRGAKKSIIERAEELFPHEVQVIRNKSGNKITGLALKPSSKRMDTYGC